MNINIIEIGGQLVTKDYLYVDTYIAHVNFIDPKKHLTLLHQVHAHHLTLV